MKIVKKIIIIIIIIIILFFIVNMSKKTNFGNNISSQEIVNNILNISSYETTVEVKVTSNKNENKYLIKQKYIAPDVLEQEVLEPENIKGLKISKKLNELKIENTKMNISKIYNNYEYMTDNCIDLNTFINDYKNSTNQIDEKDEEIILKLENEKNKYIKYRMLYIDKKTGNPTKMEIKNDSKKTIIYILYKEVKFNI